MAGGELRHRNDLPLRERDHVKDDDVGQWDEEQELLRRADEVRMRRAGNVDSEGGKGPDAGMDASFGGRNEDTADGIVIVDLHAV